MSSNQVRMVSSAGIMTVEETVKMKRDQGYQAAATGRTDLARSLWNEALQLSARLNGASGQRGVVSLGYLEGIK
jgi:hypothetical protein